MKAMQKEGGTAAAVMAKLCIAVMKKSRHCLDRLQHVESSMFDPSLGAHIAYLREVYGVLIHFYLGEDAYAKADCGVAIAWLMKSQVRSFL